MITYTCVQHIHTLSQAHYRKHTLRILNLSHRFVLIIIGGAIISSSSCLLFLQFFDELARHALQGIRDGQFVIMYGHAETQATLSDRAARIGRGELPFDLQALPMM